MATAKFATLEDNPKWGDSATYGTPGGTVTYAFDTSVPQDWYQDINVSFGAWSGVADIQFSNVTGTADAANADIFIRQDALLNDAETAPDGPGGTLAVTEYEFTTDPDGSTFVPGVTITFDSAEGWGPGLSASGHIESDTGVRLDSVGLHEIGHSIGLDHPDRDDVVMSAFENGVTQLQPDDINGAQTIYGAAAPCYCTGSLIRTVRGDVAVEDLAIGDSVVTASGAERPIKWIGTRSYAGRFANANPDVLPIRFHAGSLAEGVPARDLWVSPKHAMFLDGVLIPAEQLVNGVSVVKAERVEAVTYWHIELDSHDVLIAEGAASESYVEDDNRAMFHNARTFPELYPPERIEAVYCAPRVEDGYILEAVRRRLAERAGLPVPAAERSGALRGEVEGCDGTTVWGWAQDSAHPDAPVCLDVVVDGVLAARLYAEDFRSDLAEAGIGDGCHGFAVRLPAVVARSIEIRRSADGAALPEAMRLAA